MEIWLVRHAVAADREGFAGLDPERPLTDKGRKRFRTFARQLARRLDPPGLIVTSPLVRAAQTAELLRRALRLKKKAVLVASELSPGAEARQMLEISRTHAASRIALVGHEPDFSQALSEFIAGGEFDFGKGFIASVHFAETLDLGAGRLQWFVGPSLKSR